MLPLIKAVLSEDVCSMRTVVPQVEAGTLTDDLDDADAEGRPALMFAVELGNSEIVDILLDAGACPAATDCAGFTPLHMTAAVGTASPKIVRALVEAGASVSSGNKWGVTPLLSVAYCGHPCVLWELLECEADVDETDNLGQTPLMIASAWGQEGCVNMLITAGADVTLRSFRATTALHDAAR